VALEGLSKLEFHLSSQALLLSWLWTKGSTLGRNGGGCSSELGHGTSYEDKTCWARLLVDSSRSALGELWERDTLHDACGLAEPTANKECD
jgi:hypothetical protein